jgi:hypothetical protein
MTEEEFWLTLEYRLSRELSALSDKHLRFLMCDGFVPDEHQPQDDAIVGYAWIGDGSNQEQYRFRLSLPPDARNEKGLNWNAMVPTVDAGASWFSIDRDTKRLELRPHQL